MTMDGHNLSPFMFTVPRQFQSHELLFKVLGTKEKPNINDYTSFLLELYNNHNNKPLNINELNAVFKVIELICTQLEIGNKKINNNVYIIIILIYHRLLIEHIINLI